MIQVITSEECVPKHKLLLMDMRFKATKRRHRKFEPRVRVWKLKEEKTCEEFRCLVGDKVEEVKWKGLGVNDHWQQMKGIMMETPQDICGMTKGPPVLLVVLCRVTAYCIAATFFPFDISMEKANFTEYVTAVKL